MEDKTVKKIEWILIIIILILIIITFIIITPRIYEVKAGETLSYISAIKDISINDLMELNPNINVNNIDLIKVGDKIITKGWWLE